MGEPARELARAPTVVVLVLMYGHADEAIECISSVLDSKDVDFKVILLDNRSPDSALDHVRAWARGERAPGHAQLNVAGRAPVRHGPIDHVELNPDARGVDISRLPPLTLVDTKGNLGYAGGNNVGLRWLQTSPDWDFGWILNPDTVVDPSAMSALVAYARSNPHLGPIGARICFYDEPARIQLWGGGHFQRLRAVGVNLGLGRPASHRPASGEVERQMTYVSGASFFFPRRFLETAGLMEERYFLYFEEVDWCRRRGDLALGYEHDAIVYHRCGSSIGSSLERKKISPLSLYWSFRNRFVYTRKFDAWALPAVYLTSYSDVLRFLLAGSWQSAWIVLRTMHGGGPPKAVARARS